MLVTVWRRLLGVWLKQFLPLDAEEITDRGRWGKTKQRPAPLLKKEAIVWASDGTQRWREDLRQLGLSEQLTGNENNHKNSWREEELRWSAWLRFLRWFQRQ